MSDVPPEISFDRELGRLEGRVASLETTVESLERTVARLEKYASSFMNMLEFSAKFIKFIWWAISVIGIDALVRVITAAVHLWGLS